MSVDVLCDAALIYVYALFSCITFYIVQCILQTEYVASHSRLNIAWCLVQFSIYSYSFRWLHFFLLVSISFGPTIHCVFTDLLESTLCYIHCFLLFIFSHTTIKHSFPFAAFLSLFLFLLHITFHFGTSCKLACYTRRTHWNIFYMNLLFTSQMYSEANGLNDAREDKKTVQMPAHATISTR